MLLEVISQSRDTSGCLLVRATEDLVIGCHMVDCFGL